MGVSIRSRLYQAGELVGDVLHELDGVVSIRSRLYQAGERSITRPRDAGSGFQSAPAFIRRENTPGSYTWAGSATFQSAPAFIRRENYKRGGLLFRLYEFQSAPAFIRRENVCSMMLV